MSVEVTSTPEVRTLKVIAVASTKGGVGKTAIATNLAAAAANSGKRTLLINADKQLSVLYWDQRRKKQPEPLANIDVEQWTSELGDLDQVLDNLQDLWDIVIVDVQGSDNRALRASMLAADLILVPTAPSTEDFDVLRLETIPLLNELSEATGARAVGAIVINQWHWQAVLHKSIRNAMDAFKKEDLRICDTKLQKRLVYQNARGAGMGVTEFEPKGKAAEEISSLYHEVVKLLRIAPK